MSTNNGASVRSASVKCGRVVQLRLELFKYIIVEPENAKRLLKNLVIPVSYQTKAVEGLLF